MIDNNIAKMLAAYNGGSVLNKWLKKMNRGGDMMMFIESIPARETRIYVKAVLSNLWMYQTIWPRYPVITSARDQ